MAEANIRSDGRGPTDVPNDNFEELLLARQEDLKFVDDVTDVKCKRCDHVVIYQYEANCGHVFCENCRRVLTHGEGWRCPECKEYITTIAQQRREVEERVFGLMVHCFNHRYGCRQIMPLRLMTKHSEICEDTKDANLPMFYKGTHSMEEMMQRIGVMSKEFKLLKETVDQLQKQMEDHLIDSLRETDDKQRKDDSKWGDFESRINGLRSDLKVATTRIETLANDNSNKTIEGPTLSTELDAKWSGKKMAANLNKYQGEEIESVRELVQTLAWIENHNKQVDDNQRRDAKRIEALELKLNENQLRDTERMEALEQKVNENQRRDTLRMETLAQKVETLSNLIADLSEKLGQTQEQTLKIDVTTRNDYKDLTDKLSKVEETVKHFVPVAELELRHQSYKQVEMKLKEVDTKQTNLIKDTEGMKETIEVHNKLLRYVYGLQTKAEVRCNQKIGEIEVKATNLDQQRDKMEHKLNETVKEVEELIVKVQGLTKDCCQIHDNASEMTDLLHQPNVSQDFEMPGEKIQDVEKISYNTDRNGDLFQTQRPLANEFGEGTSHTPYMNGNNIRETKSVREHPNKPTKTKGQTNPNQRINEITTWDATNSYSYNEFIKRPTKYKVPEYNMLLMAESAAEIIMFINCFEVLTKYAKLDDALKYYHSVKPLLSTPFQFNGKEMTMANNEGVAELKQCKCYEYLFKGCLVRFIDSAGYGTTTIDDGQSRQMENIEKMTEHDGKMFQDTRHFIEKLQSLHSIVIVMKSTEMELPRSFLDSLKRYLVNFNKSRVSNLLFVITDFELAKCKVDKVAKAVEEILKYIAPTSVARGMRNTNFFLIYNEGLRSVIAQNLGERVSDSEMDNAGQWWQKASEQCRSLVTRVQHLQPWREEFFSSIFKKKPVHKSTKRNGNDHHYIYVFTTLMTINWELGVDVRPF